MSYTAITFTYGEQPSAAKWNLVGANDATFYQQLTDGWIEAGETFTYASATTITVATGATNRFQSGDKLRLKQGGSYKYFYITSVASTVLTISGGSDYTLTSATITDHYFSRFQSPFGFPAYFNLAATTKSYFKMEGKEVHVWGWGWKLGSGTTNMTQAQSLGLTLGAVPTYVSVVSLGQNAAADPDTIDDFTSQPGWMCDDFVSPSTTGFTVGFSKARTGDDSAQTLTNTVRFGYSWYVKGYF